jgi:hypothetical protein
MKQKPFRFSLQGVCWGGVLLAVSSNKKASTSPSHAAMPPKRKNTKDPETAPEEKKHAKTEPETSASTSASQTASQTMDSALSSISPSSSQSASLGITLLSCDPTFS